MYLTLAPAATLVVLGPDSGDQCENALKKDIKNSRIHRKFVYVFRGYPELGAIPSYFSKLRSPLPGQSSRPLAAMRNIMADPMR